MNTNTPQGKYLLERIQQHVNALTPPRYSRYKRTAPGTEPAAVKAARKLIQVFEQRCERENEQRHARIAKRAAIVRERVLFGTDKEALAAVKAFEAVRKL
jgi:hypothetical protein